MNGFGKTSFFSRFGSIRVKLVSIYSLLIAIIAGFIYSYFPVRQEAQAIRSVVAKTGSIADMTAFNISSALFFEDIQTIREAFQSALQNKDLVYIVVCDTTGKIVTAFNPPAEPFSRTRQWNRLSLAEGLYQTATPIIINNEEIGTLYMGFSLTELKSDISESRKAIALMSLLVFVLGIMIVIGVSMLLSRPLTEMVDTVNKISAGDLSQRAPVTSGDEIGLLAVSFNRMVEHLEASQRQLKEANQQLEDYTAELQVEIEERKRVEKKLRLSDEILSNVGNLVLVADQAGDIVYASPSIHRLLGYTVEEVLGDGWLNLTRKNEGEKEEKKYLAEAAKGETPPINEPYERLIYDKSGKVHWVLWQDARGPNNLIIGIGSIIDDRKEAEIRQLKLVKELESVNRELKDFAYVVSHDLKAPLRAIGSLANWLLNDYEDKLDEEGQELMRLLDSRVKRMHDLIEGILQYSRVGRIREEMVAVDLSRSVPAVIDLLAPPANIEVKIETDLPIITVEKTRIEQVFQNLISNAVKYMDKENGNIRIGCEEENGYWKFWVSDNGPGIDKKYFTRIFQIFQTLKPRDEYESTGVGLTLVKKIVEMYRGKIWLESEVGKGTTFYFTLPKEETNGKLLEQRDEKQQAYPIG